MKLTSVKFVFLFFLFVFSTFSSFTYAKDSNLFQKIVFFGDSLSDRGNLFSDSLGFIPKSPPYFQGRFANGMLWSERIEKHYYDKAAVSSANYALGGQTAVFHNPMGGFFPYTLTMALDKYLLGSIFRDRSKTLFIIWIGANDYLPGVKNIDELTTKVTNSIAGAVESLIYYGGVHILVFNLPDLSLTPYGRQIENKINLQTSSLLHNIKLAAALVRVQANYPNANIHLYQVDKQIKDFIDNPEIHNKKHHTHITNVTESCWKGGFTRKNNLPNEDMIANAFIKHLQTINNKKMMAKTYPDPKELAHYIALNPALLEAYVVSTEDKGGEKRCARPDDYLFWDKVHPTTVAHRMIAEDLIPYINKYYTEDTQ